MHVLHLLHDSRRSGVPAVASTLLTAFDRTRVVAAALFAYDGVYARELQAAGVEVMTMGRRLPFVWRLNRFLAMVRLPWLVRRFSVVHAHSIKMAPAAIVAKLLGARVVLHLHEKVDSSNPILRRAMALVDCVVFCAGNCADHYAGVPVRRSEVILNAIRVPEVSGTGRGTLPLKIVMLGSINRNKGQDLLLKAFALLDRSDVELYIYGTVGLSGHGFVRELQEFVRRNNLGKRVFFPGPTSDAPGVFRRADLLVHSSLNECLSISILEALAHGVAVVANDIPGMREVIADGVNGFLVPPGDVVRLAERIGQLLDDGRLREKLGTAGRETVLRRFDMQQRVMDFVRLYRELTSGEAL